MRRAAEGARGRAEMGNLAAAIVERRREMHGSAS